MAGNCPYCGVLIWGYVPKMVTTDNNGNKKLNTIHMKINGDLEICKGDLEINRKVLND